MSQAQPLSSEWRGRLGLASRRAPEYYESSDVVVDTPHALAIRIALDELGLSAVFCVQGVPTIAILNLEQFDASASSTCMALCGIRDWQACSSSLRVTPCEPTHLRESLKRNGDKNLTSVVL